MCVLPPNCWCVYAQVFRLPCARILHQAVVLRVGSRCRDEGQPSNVGETGTGSARRAAKPAAGGSAQHVAFAAGSGNSEHAAEAEAANHPYPLLTADGVWVAEVGAEGSATHVPQVRERLR